MRASVWPGRTTSTPRSAGALHARRRARDGATPSGAKSSRAKQSPSSRMPMTSTSAATPSSPSARRSRARNGAMPTRRLSPSTKPRETSRRPSGCGGSAEPEACRQRAIASRPPRRRNDERREQRDLGIWKLLKRHPQDERVGDERVRRSLVDDHFVAARGRAREAVRAEGEVFAGRGSGGAELSDDADLPQDE